MCEFSFSPNTGKKTNLSRLVMSDLLLFCSFVLSHPLYFSYFVFFSPYIIKILSFLSPLFVTTSLLLVALLTTTIVNDNSCGLSEKSRVSFLLLAYQNVLDKLRSDADADHEDQSFQQFEEFEAYKIVFDTSSSGVETVELALQGCSTEIKGSELPPPIDKHLCHESTFSAAASQEFSSITVVNEISLAEIMRAETEAEAEAEAEAEIAEIKSLGGFLKEDIDNDSDYVDVSCEKESVKSVNKGDELKEEELSKKGSGSKAEIPSKAADDKQSLENHGEHSWKNMEDSQNIEANLGSFGSMRKEKEWRRTLACKLFEERHNCNVEGSEGMDLLWETYETTDHSSKQQMLTKNRTKKGKRGSKYDNDEEEDEEEEEEEMDDGQLCCLQALKFSAGKMNLGMGRPNLMKISKALKGFGWLHNVTKHGKKMYH
ncbi:Acidic leucine-rich nuclear phosphoprotein 32 family B protein [Melia azedarach]|uniref:Acidic leucine-rich nuclear phosphoprotein 32 family B protein n=1 Tax=Melia azedarach TaxID=155640 RepID=A0ACC1YXJ4_MELAZ|nr:Acidic leucine-rich nuclear phosphoprotein 32 family B protein [Melia azedarach]